MVCGDKTKLIHLHLSSFLASFKNKQNDVIKMIRCEDMSKTKEEKVNEFWKTLEYLDKKG